ncbi:serine/threonine-protein kinase [Paenibacillus taihuensis]|uniref:Serine/threonine-protein kinase n=1 Tax=Paenibacillus taihuensis TaxID=1156355 RepID=A0A3D9RQT5_9BACL|nr:serine/threonine-protein kinase [Paenibacillus taihuensis]REE80061.1 serine/threonine-protein kinase [Paenibacillus taihuensis]
MDRDKLSEQMGQSIEPGVIVGGRYRVIGRIGRGGMGEVYAAEDIRLQGKLRAVKRIRIDARYTSRSDEEAGLLMRLNHPHLPLIIDYFPPDQQGYELLVMDYIEGMTLQSYLRENDGVIPPARAVDIGMQLADALHYLHTRNPVIIHRDLKPTNVMIDRDGFVRLIDFGIAREYKPGQEQDTVQLGTPGFSAPEQEGDQQSDVRTDVFGLGALLYYLMSGGRKVVSHAGSSTVPGKMQLSHVPKELAAVISRMIEAYPSSRYSTIIEARNALAQSIKAQPAMGEIRLDSKPARKQSIIVASLSPGAGATFVTLTLAYLLQSSKQASSAAIEHPELEPEWHALLPQTAKQQTAALTVPMYRSFSSPGSQHVQWYLLDPSFKIQQNLDWAMQYKLLCTSIQAPIQLTDVSSKWAAQSSSPPDLELSLINCDMLLFVVDPTVSKWSIQRMKAAERIIYERDQAGKETHWIANKAMQFRYHREWISAIPKKPLCEIPLLPAEEWMQQQWSGAWATANRSWLPQLERAFRPLLARIDKGC